MLRIALLALALPLAAQAQTPKDTGKGTVPPEAARTVGPALDASTLPDTLRPGDLDLSGVPMGESTYTVRVLQPMQVEIGSITETVTLDGDGITRTSTLVAPVARQDERVTSRFEAGTYAFRSVEMAGAMARGSLRLEDGRVVGERQIADATGALSDPVAVDDALDGPAFGSGWIHAAVQVLPLAEGSVHHVAVYSERDGQVIDRVTVLPTQTLKPGGIGATMTLVPVETFDGEQTMTYYVDPETRRIEIIRFSPQPSVNVELDRD